MKGRFSISFRKNYNEFRNVWLRWHDYVSIMINEFPILQIRRYDWLEVETRSWLIRVLCFTYRLSPSSNKERG